MTIELNQQPPPCNLRVLQQITSLVVPNSLVRCISCASGTKKKLHNLIKTVLNKKILELNQAFNLEGKEEKEGGLLYMSSCGPSFCSSSCRWSSEGWWEWWEGWGRVACCYPGCWSLRWLWRKGRSHHSPELKGNTYQKAGTVSSKFIIHSSTIGTCNKRKKPVLG